MNTGSRSPSTGDQHPDLSNEVAALSAKLITAINNQTNLDDALQETRHELDEARAYISQLEGERKQHQEALSSGILVRKVDTAREEERLQREMLDERKKRNSAERQKKGMESELENLTSQLFEEANQMVAAARHEKEKADRQTDMYKAKFEETETLLASSQAQLKQLKEVLEDEQKNSRESAQPAYTTPSTPIVGPSNERLSDSTVKQTMHTRNSLSTQSIPPPESPLHFDHLIHPVVRTDVQSYEEFVSLLRTNKGNTSPSRSTSGSYVGLNVLGLGSKEIGSQSTVIPSLRAVTRPSSRSTSAQTTPAAAGNQSPDLNSDSINGAAIALKDIKYYKRALAEDIEPTMRLDTAPGLSWLQRRTVLQSITTGRLVVEPFPRRHAFHSPAYSCALCGEARTNEEHVRRYRFRASDSDDAQRYPVCDYCLARLRSTCDFTSFLRMAKKGHMKNETVDECRSAWEECIKLREKMFWCRVGGGVVPAPGSNPVSPVNGAYPETDKESATQASRSDSDLPSITRADSQRTTSSELPDVTPISEIEAGDHLPSKEILPVDKVISRKSLDGEQDMMSKRDSRHGSLIDQFDQLSRAKESMPPPPPPELHPTQAGAQDGDPVKRDSLSTSRPSSSHASGKAFFEAREAESRGSKISSTFAAGSNPSKQSAVSTGRPSSSHMSDDRSQLDELDLRRQAPVPEQRDYNTFSRPSSSKSRKSFSFGPRNGKLSENAIDKTPASPTAVTDRTDPQLMSSGNITNLALGRSPSPPKADNIGISTNVGSAPVLRSRSPSRPPLRELFNSETTDQQECKSAPSTAPLHIPSTFLSKPHVPSRPLSQGPTATIEMPSPSTFTRPLSVGASTLKEASPVTTTPATEKQPQFSSNQPNGLHLEAPSPQPVPKATGKIAALASRFQEENIGAQSRPGSSGGSMPRGSSEGFRSLAGSPEHSGPEWRGVRSRRGSMAGSSLSSPERKETPADVGGSEMRGRGTQSPSSPSPVRMPGTFS